jgi:hypothetical protein
MEIINLIGEPGLGAKFVCVNLRDIYRVGHTYNAVVLCNAIEFPVKCYFRRRVFVTEKISADELMKKIPKLTTESKVVLQFNKEDAEERLASANPMMLYYCCFTRDLTMECNPPLQKTPLLDTRDKKNKMLDQFMRC